MPRANDAEYICYFRRCRQLRMRYIKISPRSLMFDLKAFFGANLKILVDQVTVILTFFSPGI